MVKLPPTVTESTSALPSIAVCNRHARATIYLHGAHVTSWRPVGEGEVLWMSVRSHLAPGKPIRGGVPICFPWFGAHPERSDLAPHGFARSLPWTLTAAEDLSDGRTRVVLSLASSAETEALWPHRFALTYTVTVGRELELALQVRNAGATPFSYEEALHTYFDVGDVRRTTVDGLAGASYLDKADNATLKQQGPVLDVTGETDRLFAGATGACTINDPVLARRIAIGKAGSRSTVVWNPWSAKAARMPDFGDDEWPGMLCIEAANAGEHRVTLPPGEAHTLGQTIAVAR